MFLDNDARWLTSHTVLLKCFRHLKLSEDALKNNAINIYYIYINFKQSAVFV